jgi:hypothetical protein
MGIAKTVEHTLAMNPYSTALIEAFPPSGLEYIVASMKDPVGKVTQESMIISGGDIRQVTYGCVTGLGVNKI